MLHNTAFFDHCTLAKGPRATDPDSTWVRPEHGKRCLEGLPLVDKLNRVLRGVGQLLQRRLHQQGVSRARQLCGCAVASVVALQAQGQATQARELSTLAPLRDLRAHASDPAWTRRAVDEGVEVLSESAVREIRLLRSMSGVWRRSYGRPTKAPPDERGGNRHGRPNTTAPHPDSAQLSLS